MQGVIIGCLALLTIGMVTWRKPRVHRDPVRLPTNRREASVWLARASTFGRSGSQHVRMTQGIVVLGRPLPKARPITSAARIAASLRCSRAMELSRQLRIAVWLLRLAPCLELSPILGDGLIGQAAAVAG